MYLQTKKNLSLSEDADLTSFKNIGSAEINIITKKWVISKSFSFIWKYIYIYIYIYINERKQERKRETKKV